MSFKATLSNNQTETQSFHNISNLYDITVLETEDVAPLKIDFATGEISINNTIQTRISEYFYPYAKPIQYRKVSHDIILVELGDIEITNEWEEQYIGYEYTANHIKTKLELCSNTEIQAISVMITITDLVTEEKTNKVMRLY